jgi:hypothetical protein
VQTPHDGEGIAIRYEEDSRRWEVALGKPSSAGWMVRRYYGSELKEAQCDEG